jgi:hypothetical protein
MSTSSPGTILHEALGLAARGGGAQILRSTVHLQPASGWLNPVIRAAVYSDGGTTIGGTADRNGNCPGPAVSTLRSRDGVERRVVQVQSVEARGHAVMAGVASLRERGVAVPVIEMYASPDAVEGGEEPLTSSFAASHHVADAVWREAVDADGAAFWDGSGRTIDPRRPIEPSALLRLYPVSLLLGYDPRSCQVAKPKPTTKTNAADPAEELGGDVAVSKAPTGRPVVVRPLGKAVRSEIVAEVAGLRRRTQSVLRDHQLAYAGRISITDGQWEIDPKGTQKLSNANLGSVAPALRDVPDIEVSSVTASTYLSFTALRALRFDSDGEEDAAQRTLLNALGVAGVVLAERSFRIRADCDLVIDPDRGGVVRELVGRDGGTTTMEITEEAAVAAVQLSVEHLREVSGDRLWWADEEPVIVYAGRRYRRLLGV